MRCLYAFTLMYLCLGSGVSAQSYDTIGTGRLFTNDYLGDGRDRWQSGAYVHSTLKGPTDWEFGGYPFGDILEYRFRSFIISSDGFGDPPGDRPYVGGLSFGMHGHYASDATRASFGADLTAIGPQVGIANFQREAHEFFGLRPARFTDHQLDDAFLLGVTGELAQLIPASDTVTTRPFVQALVGPENILRVGADVMIGSYLANEILIRDEATGHLYRGTQSADAAGLAFIFGADVAGVGRSAYLPESHGITALGNRQRLRAGMHWQAADESSVFYGLTYLSPEFDGQTEGQITGSVKLNFNF